MTNPFSVIILAQLIAHNTTNNNEDRYLNKFKLVKLLYQRGYQRKDISALFRLIDWMLALPTELELQLNFKIEEELKMPYVTSYEKYMKEKIEAEAAAKGEARGEARGEANILLTLLKLKFGVLSDSVEQQIKTAEKNQLDKWVENILTADSLDSLLTTTP